MPIDPALLEDIIDRLVVARDVEAQLAEAEITQLSLRATDVFMSQSLILELPPPVKICGDIHGLYFDLLRLFEYGGFPPEANYLFLRNYVDRGKQSIEIICLLHAYKMKYRENFLLRGNHERASINLFNGFYVDCKRRFNCLPIAALIEKKIMCMHGDLSPDLKNLDQIRNIVRPVNVRNHGLLHDLLCSDPDKNIEGWGRNFRRLCCTFGPDKVSEFLQEHNLDLICRSHQVVEKGYEFFAGHQLVTIFSAPNYCGEFNNAGAMMVVEENLLCSFQILKPFDNNKKVIGSGMSIHGIPPSKACNGVIRTWGFTLEVPSIAFK